MLIRRMTATFGTLQNRTLDLKEGLNILEAPNEAGKSTWCAFLLSMFYGIDSRQRDRAGRVADKNRFAPWSGAPMGGRMDLLTLDGELTLTRATSRAGSPMGDFRAVYAGTGETVPGLTAQSCGETLLGVTRDVYERSAFIRQAGLAVTQSAELERRIASLISSGEEDTSYTEAAETLRKQKNRRRFRQSGQIPTLEKELRDIREQITESEKLERKLADARTKLMELERREAALQLEAARIERYQAATGRQEAENSVSRAEAYAASLRQELEERRIPDLEAIGRLRGALVNLLTAQKSARQAEDEQEDAEQRLRSAEEAASHSPFSGMTPTEAEHAPVDLPPKPQFPMWMIWLMVLLCVALGGAVWQASGHILAGLFVTALCGGLLYFPSRWIIRQRVQSWETLSARKHKRRQAELDQYAGLYLALEDARMEAASKASAARGIVGAYQSNEQAFLHEVRRFAPSVSDLMDADQELRTAAQQRKELAAAEAAVRESGIRRDILEEHMDLDDADADPGVKPTRGREEVYRELEQVRNALSDARSDADRLTGRLHEAGDPVVLRSSAAHAEDELGVLEEEYEALSLAADTLDHANAVLQSRFSPELGKRASEIFASLTEGRYGGVALDRSFRLSAEYENTYRSAAVLSAGCADQLYLAVRLAICEMVLPADRAVPVVLDDALTNFDDKRCAAALRYLKTLSEKRQILLFTCHSREAAFFAGDSGVSVQRLG